MVGQLSLPFLPQELGKAIVLGGWDALTCVFIFLLSSKSKSLYSVLKMSHNDSQLTHTALKFLAIRFMVPFRGDYCHW